MTFNSDVTNTIIGEGGQSIYLQSKIIGEGGNQSNQLIMFKQSKQSISQEINSAECCAIDYQLNFHQLSSLLHKALSTHINGG